MMMAFASLGSFAQSAPGTFTLQPKIGMNVSTVTDESNIKARIGFTGGAELGYQVNNIFAITGGLMYSMQGAKSDFEELNGTVKLDYINIPILANVYVLKGLALKAGIQPAFNVNKSVSVGGISMDIEDAYKNVGIDCKVNTFDLSMPMGISYETHGIVLDARYNLGLTKIFNADFEYEGKRMKPDEKHSVFQFTIGYKFNL